MQHSGKNIGLCQRIFPISLAEGWDVSPVLCRPWFTKHQSTYLYNDYL